MKCKVCSSCSKGYFKSQPDKYVCIGVKEPFIIKDINHECTEYPEKNSELNNKNNVYIKHTSLNMSEEIKRILPDTLEKDLKDNEIICPVCHGLGIIKKDYHFGVKEDNTEKSFKLNWYDNEYLTLCPNCYFGRIKTCKYCGKPLQKQTNRCSCDGYRKQEAERLKKYIN